MNDKEKMSVEQNYSLQAQVFVWLRYMLRILTFFPDVSGDRLLGYIVVVHVRSISPVTPVRVRRCFACMSKACPVFHVNKPV